MFQSCIQMSQSCFWMSESCLELVRDIFQLFLFLFITLAKKNWLQKHFTENIEAIWASSFKIRAKLRYKSNFQCTSLRRWVCWSCFVTQNVSPKWVSVRLFTVKTLSFPPQIWLRIRFIPWKTKFISLKVKFPAVKSKFQFCAMASLCGRLLKGKEKGVV